MKTIIITGSNSGIGKEAALILAKEGHRILMLCRDSEKSTRAHQEIVEKSGNKDVLLIPVDLSDPDSIRDAVAEIKSQHEAIDVLVNNAGVAKIKRAETVYGVEMTFAVNFLASYMLSEMLLENLEASGDGRIINIVSDQFKKGSIDLDNLMIKERYLTAVAYNNSNLAKVLHTVDLANRTRKKGITINALNPGTLATDLYRELPAFLMKFSNLFSENPRKGGERIAYLATSEEVKVISGKYFFKTEQQEIDIPAEDLSRAEGLWQIAEELTSTE